MLTELNSMPKFNIEALDKDSELYQELLLFIPAIFKKDNTLYVTKPKRATIEQQYVWRILCFCVSPKPVHQHIPMGASMDILIAYGTEKQMEIINHLERIVDELLKGFKKDEKYGLLRWSNLI